MIFINVRSVMKYFILILLIVISTNAFSANKSGKSGKGYRESYGENLDEYSLLSLNDIIEVKTMINKDSNLPNYELVSYNIESDFLNLNLKSEQLNNNEQNINYSEIKIDFKFQYIGQPLIAAAHYLDYEIKPNLLLGLNLKNIKKYLKLNNNKELTYKLDFYLSDEVIKQINFNFKLTRSGKINMIID